MTTTEIRDLVRQAASVYQLPENLLFGQVLAESNGDPFAFRYEHDYFGRYIQTNPAALGFAYGPLAACSYGLLQIMFETALEIGYADRPEGLFVPRVGLAFGSRYMVNLLAWAQGDYQKALSAYNGGKGTAAKGPPYSNQSYVSRVYTLAGSGVTS
jgi:soluble lytic murein transglycosylase-like protein